MEHKVEEIKLPIDISKGKIPQKKKGSLVPIEESMEELRRYSLEIGLWI